MKTNVHAPRKMILAGGSGFLGQALADYFTKLNWEVVILTRTLGKTKFGREVTWNGREQGDWFQEIEGATCLINLSGKSVDCRYTRKNRQEILDSRVLPTQLLNKAVRACRVAPRLWINLSTATIYKHNFGAAWDENGTTGAAAEAKDEFSVEVARQWEGAFFQSETSATRKVAIRLAMVLGHAKNSVFPVLMRLARFGLGGHMASGKQYVSWIHVQDFCRAIHRLIDDDQFAGVVNLAAPNSLTNREMMKAVRKAAGMPFGLPAPLLMLELGAFFMRTETELIIKSRRVVPGRLLAGGFKFEYPDFKGAIEDLAG